MILLIPQEGQGWQIRIVLRQHLKQRGVIEELEEDEEEDDGEGSSSYADEISPDISDPN